MHCQEIRQQLAVYRELSPAERDRLEEHLATCPSCRATLATYRAQDQLLATLPVLTPSPALVEAVHARTVGRNRAARPYSWQRATAALSLLLCLSIAWGTVSRASGALPGDVLYPIKRGAEQVRLALSFNPAARDRYQQHLVETRREEVRAVIRLEREARVEFQGDLVAVDTDLWQVDGFGVTVSAEVWGGVPPPVGMALAVEAEAARGELRATRVRLLEPELRAPTPQASPAAQPSDTPATGGPGPQPSVTPGAWGPGPQPSITPNAWGPGPQPSMTPGAWGPGPQQSVTPTTWGPGPQPSVTPTTRGLESQPSVTPTSWGPGPQPSITPTTWGPGSQPSVTLTSWGPGPQPSVTPTTRGPGSQPSVTPTSWGPGPQPSVTPGSSATAEPGPQPSSTAGGPGQRPTVTSGPGGR